MAIRFPGGGTSYLDYVGGAPDTNNCTVVGWAQLATDSNDYVSCLPRFRNSGDSTTLWLGMNASGTQVSFATPTNGEFTTGKDLVVGKWMPIAFSSASATGTAYAADSEGGPVTTGSGAMAGNTPAAKYCFGARGPSDTTENFNGALAGMKIYNGTLSLAEIRAEWSQILPVRTAGLYAAYPLDLNSLEGRLDASGNGRMLVLGGTGLTTVDGPPIPKQRIRIRQYQRAGAASAGSTTGAIAGNLPTPTGALAGTVTATGVLAGSLPTPTGALAGGISASGVLAGSLPTPTGALTGSVAATGVLAGSLPTPAGALSCSLSASGALAGSLPTPTGSLTGSVAATGVIAGALPTPTGTFGSSSNVDGAVAGSLPTPTGALAGTVSWLGSTAGQLPALTGALSGIISASGLISGLLPGPTQSLVGVIRVNGLIAGVLPALTGSFSNIVFVSDLTRWEMAIYRLNTKEFIKADPIKITLHTRLYARTATGGVSTSAGSNRPEQTFKLIMQSPAGNSLEQRTQDGTERQVDYILLGEWNAQVEVGDWWEDAEQNVWEVVALVPYNGYETRAVVEAHGKTLEGG